MPRMERGEGRLLLAVAVLVLLINVPYGNYVLYPFALFGTWVHELCHALAALALGGRVDHIEIFSDTSGLAWTAPGGRLKHAVVASAGYTGTAIGGAALLLFRKKERAGQIGLSLLGAAMVLSAVVWVRNGFGTPAILVLGVALLAAGRALPRELSGWLYTFLAAVTSLDAVTSIQTLFGATHLVNGKPSSTDARTVGELLLVPWFVWAAAWLALALVCAFVGLRYALPATPGTEGRDDHQRRSVS